MLAMSYAGTLVPSPTRGMSAKYVTTAGTHSPIGFLPNPRRITVVVVLPPSALKRRPGVIRFRRTKQSRVGKGCVSTCRSRVGQDNEQKKNDTLTRVEKQQ